MKIFQLLFLVLLPIYAHSQFQVWIDDNNQLKTRSDIDINSNSELIVNDEKPASRVVFNIENDKITPCELDTTSYGGIDVSVDCENNLIVFNNGSAEIKVYACRGVFAVDCEQENGTTLETSGRDSTIVISNIPWPSFKYPAHQTPKSNSRNRYLIIDAHPNPEKRNNTGMYKMKKDKESDTALLTTTNNVHVHSSISVFIRNAHLGKLDYMRVHISGKKYSYDQDLLTLYSSTKEAGANIETKDTSQFTSFQDEKGDSSQAMTLEEYLDSVYINLKDIKYLDISDYYRLQTYKSTLRASLSQIKEPLSREELSNLSKIFGWYPEYISLSSISLPAEEEDETEIKLEIKYENAQEPKTQKLGIYRATGGITVSINNMVFITNLKNNPVYADSTVVDEGSGEKELRAIIAEEDQLNIGIGMNAELSFRTGCILRPTINVGFFIPFEADISPFIGLGGGLSIGNSKVKLALSAGLALGKINTIAERYRDRDLSAFENLINESLVEKVWKTGWQAGVGVSYSLN